MNGRSVLRHPLVTRYLAELEHLLAGLHPAERAEVLTGVGEHLEESLAGSDDSDVAVRSALDELGPAAAVADAAYDGRGQVRPSALSAQAPAPRAVPATSRAWLPLTQAVLQALALLLVAFILMSIPAGSWVTPAVLGLLTTFPFWPPAVLLVLLSGLWGVGEKITLVVLVPGLAAGVPILFETVLASAGSSVLVTVFALAVVAVLAILVVLTRRAVHRAHVLVT